MAHAGHALDDACGEEGGDDDGEQWHWQIEHAPWMPATSPTVQRRWDSLPAAARRRAPPRPARGPRRGRRRRSSRRRCSPRRPPACAPAPCPAASPHQLAGRTAYRKLDRRRARARSHRARPIALYRPELTGRGGSMGWRRDLRRGLTGVPIEAGVGVRLCTPAQFWGAAVADGERDGRGQDSGHPMSEPSALSRGLVGEPVVLDRVVRTEHGDLPGVGAARARVAGSGSRSARRDRCRRGAGTGAA